MRWAGAGRGSDHHIWGRFAERPADDSRIGTASRVEVTGTVSHLISAHAKPLIGLRRRRRPEFLNERTTMKMLFVALVPLLILQHCIIIFF